jgi:hypothetical protein
LETIADDTKGKSNVSASETKFDCSPVETVTDIFASLPAATFAHTEEKDTQTERRAEVPEIFEPGEEENTPKNLPKM